MYEVRLPYMSRLTLAAAVAAALIPLAACGSSDSSSDEAWTFTDDLGTKISLDAAPKRIVAQSSVAAALTDLGLGDRIVGTFGPLKNPDGEPDVQAEGLDQSKVKDVTGSGDYGDVDVEKLAGLRPDIVITSTYIEPQLWYVNEASEAKIKKRYDIAAISFQDKTLPQIFDGTERLAAALGADTSGFSEGRDAFGQAAERLQSVYEAQGDPSIVAVSPAADVLYVSSPDANPDLKYYRDTLKLNIVSPKKPDDGGYFESLSWEKADQYDADVAIWDARGGSAALKGLEAQPVWNKTKAGRDKAYVAWNSVAAPSAAGYARIIESFADGLEKVAQ
ncbi:MAG: ABC transporter substrate-binding protein [Actinomycetales bacterium]|nr:MAG: ABC transporter substrate-binding protein [Actinomycetales bacterium]